MAIQQISFPEKIILLCTALLTLAGLVLYYADLPLFLRYVQEDGLVEWLTVVGLLLGSWVCLRRVWQLRRVKPLSFLILSFLFGLVLFFGAGEEISWGQRILDISSPEYFQKNNAQGETNIHNLVLGGWRLNRWIFSILLSVVLFSYILLVPFFYRKKAWIRRIVDDFGIPLPQSYQVVAFLAVFLLTEAIRDGKRAEVLEAGTAIILFLILLFPMNRHTFTKLKG